MSSNETKSGNEGNYVSGFLNPLQIEDSKDGNKDKGKGKGKENEEKEADEPKTDKTESKDKRIARKLRQIGKKVKDNIEYPSLPNTEDQGPGQLTISVPSNSKVQPSAEAFESQDNGGHDELTVYSQPQSSAKATKNQDAGRQLQLMASKSKDHLSNVEIDKRNQSKLVQSEKQNSKMQLSTVETKTKDKRSSSKPESSASGNIRATQELIARVAGYSEKDEKKRGFAYKVLGVKRDVDSKERAKVFAAHMTKLHPDKLLIEPSDESRLAYSSKTDIFNCKSFTKFYFKEFMRQVNI